MSIRAGKRYGMRFGYVYVVQCGPYYKIGYSKDPDKRIKSLATQPPFELEIIHVIGHWNAYQLESDLHEMFRDKRVRGEWFELDAIDLNKIGYIQKAVGTIYVVSYRLEQVGITRPIIS